MKIVTTTGFYGTGSSAITDLLSEYDNVACKGDFEIRIAHDPYGISDLEYNLVDNPNKNNSSNSLKKFISMVERLHSPVFSRHYEEYFNNRFRKYAYEYINDIVEFNYYGRWHYDLIERGKIVFFLSRAYNKFFVILKRIFGIKNDVDHALLSEKEPAYGTITDRDKFLVATRTFFKKIIDEINPECKEIVMVDQLVPPTNIARYERYIPNLYTIVVDRDPRDIYILEKKYWKGHTVPYYDVDVFCKWYEWTRRQYEIMPKGNSIKIQFEDLIFNYNETVKKIEEFIGVAQLNHINPETIFIPKKSEKNTRLWEKHIDCLDDIKIIEKKLANYCFTRY